MNAALTSAVRAGCSALYNEPCKCQGRDCPSMHRQTRASVLAFLRAWPTNTSRLAMIEQLEKADG